MRLANDVSVQEALDDNLYDDYNPKFKRYMFIAILIGLVVGLGVIAKVAEVVICKDTPQKLLHFDKTGISYIEGFVPNWQLEDCLKSIDELAYETEGYLVYDVKYKTNFLITHIIFQPYLDDNLSKITPKEKYLEIVEPYLKMGITFK